MLLQQITFHSTSKFTSCKKLDMFEVKEPTSVLVVVLLNLLPIPRAPGTRISIFLDNTESEWILIAHAVITRRQNQEKYLCFCEQSSDTF